MIEITITFLALLALIALAGGLLVWGGLKWSPTTTARLGPAANVVAGSVATVATLGSLFMSEIAGFTPCLLCWVQRGFMYPLMLVHMFRRLLRIPSLWLSGWALGGALVSAFHYAEEHIPALGDSTFCLIGVPCSFIWFERFGFVTLPFMAFSGFLAIASLMVAEHLAKRASFAPTDRRVSK